MKLKFCFFLIALLSMACSQDNGSPEGPTPPPELYISYGVQCGWGSVLDSMRINPDSLHIYENRAPSHLHDTSLAVAPALLFNLEDSLDWQSFTTLNYNQGGLDADGCNFWLRIEHEKMSHGILFNFGDTLYGMKPFIETLNLYWQGNGQLHNYLDEVEATR